MPPDSVFDRLVRRLRRSKQQQYEPPYTGRGDIDPQKRKGGFFKGARNFVVNDGTFTIDNRQQIIQNFLAGNPEADPALKQVAEYADLDATVDSSARDPPPSCHPGTRLRIGNKLFDWLINPNREWDMQWLNGPPGTGKSAVAQTFAERCDENHRLGASFFFSKLNNRNNPNTVVPTLIYQLAVSNPEYKSLVAAQLVNDPELLRKKTRRAQFKKLIIEPFSFLQTRGHPSVQDPLLIVLDGLDECERESAQREIIEMISEVVRLKKDFPLIWLICSRPEAHLKYVFSKADFTVNCGREELAINAEAIADVEFYLRDGLAGIKAEYQEVTTPMWPPEDQIATLSRKASGHFGFASISLRYISDPTTAAPMSQLDSLLSFFSGIRPNADNPLKALDTLYTGILRDAPGEVLPIIKLLLGQKLYHLGSSLNSAQIICCFLRIDQMMFYNALRKLHSVVNVPSPEAASKSNLEFYHLSFSDYLKDPSRSSGFFIEKRYIYLEYGKLSLSWYKIDLELFHNTDGPVFNKSHEHGVLPDLKWTSDSNGKISRSLAKHVAVLCWANCADAAEWDEALLSQIRNFDFRYIQTRNLWSGWRSFINQLWENTSDGFIRTEPRGEVDHRLLKYMESMIGSWWRGRPATFPLKLRRDGRGGEYFLLGDGAKAVVCWTTGLSSGSSFGLLNCDKAPSEKQISDYDAFLMRERAVKMVALWQRGRVQEAMQNSVIEAKIIAPEPVDEKPGH